MRKLLPVLLLVVCSCGWLTTADGNGETPLDKTYDTVESATATGELLGIPYAKPVGAVILAVLAAMGAKKGAKALMQKNRATPSPAPPP